MFKQRKRSPRRDEIILCSMRIQNTTSTPLRIFNAHGNRYFSLTQGTAFRENAPEWAFHMRSGKRSKKEKRSKKNCSGHIWFVLFG